MHRLLANSDQVLCSFTSGPILLFCFDSASILLRFFFFLALGSRSYRQNTNSVDSGRQFGSLARSARCLRESYFVPLFLILFQLLRSKNFSSLSIRPYGRNQPSTRLSISIARPARCPPSASISKKRLLLSYFFLFNSFCFALNYFDSLAFTVR